MLSLLATSEAHCYNFVLLLLLAYSQTGHRGFFSASTGTPMAQSMLQSMRWRYGDLLGLQSARPLYDLWMSTYRYTADAGFCEARRLASRILAFCKQEDTLYFLKNCLIRYLRYRGGYRPVCEGSPLIRALSLWMQNAVVETVFPFPSTPSYIHFNRMGVCKTRYYGA